MMNAKNANNYAKKAERGKVVSVRLHGGEVVKRVVWEVAEDAVYLCSARLYDRLLAGDNTNRPVGFPTEDVVWGLAQA